MAGVRRRKCTTRGQILGRDASRNGVSQQAAAGVMARLRRWFAVRRRCSGSQPTPPTRGAVRSRTRMNTLEDVMHLFLAVALTRPGASEGMAHADLPKARVYGRRLDDGQQRSETPTTCQWPPRTGRPVYASRRPL